jgi:hypothetical protein
MLLNLKGVFCGTILFAFATFIYVALRMRQISNQFPPHEVQAGVKTVVGVDIHALAEWTYLDPMFWIIFIVALTLCSVLFQLWKAPVVP